MKILLSTIAIGESYLQTYSKLFRSSHEEYAKRNGYDFKVITEYQSDLKHPDSVCFEKYLLCTRDWAKNYDYIIYIDADILINPKAQYIPFDNLGDKIGMVDEYSQPTPDIRIQFQKSMGWEEDARGYFTRHLGKPLETTKVFNGGLMVFQPIKHRDLCSRIYSEFASQNIGHSAGYHFEQATTNYELQTADMIATLPNEFNRIRVVAKSTTMYDLDECFNNTSFLHFAGHVEYDQVETLYRCYSSTVAGFYQCYKQKAAFEHSIRAFRAVYPKSNLFVFNDGGDETLGKIAEECAATYEFCQRSVDADQGLAFSTSDRAMSWLHRINKAVMKD